MVIIIDNFDINSAINVFGLTFEQTKLIFSIQRCMIIQDIKIESIIQRQKNKYVWYKQWREHIESYLNKLINKDENLETNITLYEKDKDLLEAISNEKANGSNVALALIYFEVSIFRPYFNLVKSDSEQEKVSLTDKLKTYVNKFELSSKKNYNSYNNYFSDLLGTGEIIKEGFFLEYLTFIRASASLSKEVVRDLGISILSVIIDDIYSLRSKVISEHYIVFACGILGTRNIDGKIKSTVAGFFIMYDVDDIDISAIYIKSSAFILSQVVKLEVILKGLGLSIELDEVFIHSVLNRLKINRCKLENIHIKLREERLIDEVDEIKLGESLTYLDRSIERIKKIFNI